MNQVTTLGTSSQELSGRLRQVWLGLVLAVLVAIVVSATWPSTPDSVGPTGGRITPALTYIREAPAADFQKPVGALTHVREAPAEMPSGTISDTDAEVREATG